MTSPDPVGPPPKGPLTCDNEQSGTGRTPTSDPLLDPLDLAIEGSGPVHIVPGSESTATNPPDVYAERMSRVDGCPECVTNVEAPSSVYDTADGFLANYVCQSPSCGYAWTTGWGD